MAQTLTKKLDSAIESAQEVVALPQPHTHFFTPQTVSSNFTGREKELNILKGCLSPRSSVLVEIQKRFVIFGLAGSGKTQFCCKFAADNKQR